MQIPRRPEFLKIRQRSNQKDSESQCYIVTKTSLTIQTLASPQLPKTITGKTIPQIRHKRQTVQFLFDSSTLQPKSLIDIRGKSRSRLKTSPNGNEKQLRETDDTVKKSKSRKKLSIKDFLLVKQLGRGRHGRVFIAVHRLTGFIGALKIFEKPQKKTEGSGEGQFIGDLVNQLKIQSFCNHPNIIKIYGYFSDQKYIYFFMQIGPDGQLFDLFAKHKTFKEDTISFICRALLQSLEYLHQNNIIHRDLKPQNIVLVQGVPKLCDFGESSICQIQNGQLRKTLCGTPLYLSPEILLGQQYDQKIDIWALGALGYQLYTGSNPFNVTNKEELKKVVTQEFVMKEGSAHLCNFLTRCLNKNAEERPTATRLLRHAFILRWSELETAQELCH